MPTKLNRAGKQQPYIPEGNGDASGEYADGQGYNVNKPSTNDSKTGTSGKVETQPQNQPVKPKQNIPTPAEREKLGNMGIITEDMKTAEFTKNFAPDVKITRGSLNKDEIGEFNAYLQNIFNEYPDMQKFRKISVRNNEKSSTGGYILTSTNYKTGEKSYELYVNAGWLDKPKTTIYEKDKKILEDNINFYKMQVKIHELDEDKKRFLSVYQQGLEDAIEKYEEFKVNSDKDLVSTTSDLVEGRSKKLYSIITHELMHRIFGDIKNYNNDSDFEMANQKIGLMDRCKEVYSTAISNGDAKKISKYATTNREEFICEAYARMELGFDVPKYIKELVEDIQNFNRR